MAQGPRLTIDRLRLQLPAGLQPRADAIARAVARHLAALPLSSSARLERLAVTAGEPRPGETDAVIASRIAGQIHSSLRKQLQTRQPGKEKL